MLTTVYMKRAQKLRHPLNDLRGICKDLFESLGGGETLIRLERESLNALPDNIGLDTHKIIGTLRDINATKQLFRDHFPKN